MKRCSLSLESGAQPQRVPQEGLGPCRSLPWARAESASPACSPGPSFGHLTSLVWSGWGLQSMVGGFQQRAGQSQARPDWPGMAKITGPLGGFHMGRGASLPPRAVAHPQEPFASPEGAPRPGGGLPEGSVGGRGLFSTVARDGRGAGGNPEDSCTPLEVAAMAHASESRDEIPNACRAGLN